MVGRKIVGQARAVLLGLDFHARKRGAFRFGLDDSRRLLVHIEQVVGSAVTGLQGELAYRYPDAGVQVDGVGVLHGPPCLLKQPVDVYAGLFFGCHGDFNLTAESTPFVLFGELLSIGTTDRGRQVPNDTR